MNTFWGWSNWSFFFLNSSVLWQGFSQTSQTLMVSCRTWWTLCPDGVQPVFSLGVCPACSVQVLLKHGVCPFPRTMLLQLHRDTLQGHFALGSHIYQLTHSHSPTPPDIHSGFFFYGVFNYNAPKLANHICSLTGNAFITNVSVTSNNTETYHDHAVLIQHVAGALFK